MPDKPKHLATGCRSIDKMARGGFPTGCISLLYGEATTGKTTMAMQTSVECARRGLKVLYVDADHSFSHQRLSQIAYMDLKDLGPNIVIFLPETFREQTSLVESFESYMTRQVGLVVVDTVSSLYRVSGNFPQRVFTLNRELNRQLAYLADLAAKHGVAVLITSQVHSLVDMDGGVEPVARRILFYWPKLILNLKKTIKTNVKEAILERYFSKEGSSSHCYFLLTEKGIEDAEH